MTFTAKNGKLSLHFDAAKNTRYFSKENVLEHIIETQSLTKIYGNTKAVHNLSMHVDKGDIYGLIGKNGAGKTTLMRLILGLSKENQGSIKIFGSEDLDAGRKRIGSLIEAPGLYTKHTALENLRRFALLSPTGDEDIHALLEKVNLSYAANKVTGGFSLGMRQRLGLAIAMLGNPDVLILDEPINGLDPAGIKEMRDVILDLNAKGVTFIISSHLLDELGKIATKYGIIAGGVLVEELTAEELARKCVSSLRIVTDNAEAASNIIKSFDSNADISAKDNTVYISSIVNDVSELNQALVKGGVRVYELRNESVSLEDFFIERMGR